MFLWSRNDVINMHQRRYTVPELRGKLEAHGFRVLRISYNNFFIFPLAALLILLRRGRAEPELASPHFDEECVPGRDGTGVAAGELGADGRGEGRGCPAATDEPAVRHLDHRDRGEALAQFAWLACLPVQASKLGQIRRRVGAAHTDSLQLEDLVERVLWRPAAVVSPPQ